MVALLSERKRGGGVGGGGWGLRRGPAHAWALMQAPAPCSTAHWRTGRSVQPMSWHSMAQHGTAWHSMAQHGTAWHGIGSQVCQTKRLPAASLPPPLIPLHPLLPSHPLLPCRHQEIHCPAPDRRPPPLPHPCIHSGGACTGLEPCMGTCVNFCVDGGGGGIGVGGGRLGAGEEVGQFTYPTSPTSFNRNSHVPIHSARLITIQNAGDRSPLTGSHAVLAPPQRPLNGRSSRTG